MTKAFSSEEGEIGKLSWAGGFRGGSPSFSPPTITNTNYLQSIILSKMDKTPVLVGLRGGFEVIGREEEGKRHCSYRVVT